MALELVTTAEAGPLDEFQRARADLLRGHVSSPRVWALMLPPGC
jgi:hypothetical protein